MNPAKDFKPYVEEWIGIDLDRTLAKYTHWVAADVIGEPIPEMIALAKKLLATHKVRIFTARVWHDGTTEMFERANIARLAIQKWCKEHIGQELPITCVKDLGCLAIYDDIAKQVLPNEGAVLEDILPEGSYCLWRLKEAQKK